MVGRELLSKLLFRCEGRKLLAGPEYVLAGRFLAQFPARLASNKAYDSDPLDRTLRGEYGIEMIAPNRCNRSGSQDGRKLRRYRGRWQVERLFA